MRKAVILFSGFAQFHLSISLSLSLCLSLSLSSLSLCVPTQGHQWHRAWELLQGFSSQGLQPNQAAWLCERAVRASGFRGHKRCSRLRSVLELCLQQATRKRVCDLAMRDGRMLQPGLFRHQEYPQQPYF